MVETVNSERIKTETELAHILRWEDDGGVVFDIVNPLPQTDEEEYLRSMDAAREQLFIKKQRLYRLCREKYRNLGYERAYARSYPKFRAPIPKNGRTIK
jgi:hypothetical protein